MIVSKSSSAPIGQVASGGFDIWTARRQSVSDPWGTPTVVVELSSNAFDTDPSITRDGLTIFIASDRGGLPHNDLFVSQRADRLSRRTTPMPVTELNTTADDRAITTSGDQLALVFFLLVRGSANNDLYAVGLIVIRGGISITVDK